ncbi:MAG: hypothetical protein ACPLXC_02375 [Candidatus Pacearchaeota archaeon]
MKGYLTYCYCKQDSEKFEKLDEKVDPNFKEGSYKVCHREIRNRIQVGDFLFLRTNWRNEPYIIGYYEISEKRDSETGKILIAKNRLCIDFNLEIDRELLNILRPELNIDLKSETVSWVKYVNNSLGCRGYLFLNEEKTKTLVKMIHSNSWG